MYVSGATPSVPTSDPVQRPGSSSTMTWHKGSMSRRFDGKEESHTPSSVPVATSATPVRIQPRSQAPSQVFANDRQQQPVVSSNIAKEDEQAAMAAMFQAQSANWEETQEKMSQLVSLFGAFYLRSSSDSNEHFRFDSFPFFPLCSASKQCAKDLHKSARRNYWGSAWRQAFRSPSGSASPPELRLLSVWKERLETFYNPTKTHILRVLFQGHWIQDCPTNNDREYDHKPRIKRTTGIPRSMLKAVENPSGDIGQGVMVTPEGGYVVAQPDLYVSLLFSQFTKCHV